MIYIYISFVICLMDFLLYMTANVLYLWNFTAVSNATGSIFAQFRLSRM